MSSRAEAESGRAPEPVVGERRKHQRHPGRAMVRLIRESDSRRAAVPVELVDVSITGLGVLAPQAYSIDERVKVRLRNDIRRFFKELHGVVRWSHSAGNGRFRVGIALNTRFTAIELQQLKQVGLTGDSG